MPDLFIGLMSGTSMDGIDAALVSFEDRSVNMVATLESDYPEELRHQLLAARDDSTLRDCGDVPELHQRVGECFRDAANELLSSTGTDPSSVAAIGSHGQTLRHEPDAEQPFSLQIGDPDLIARGTGITTVADFRTADIQLGGQGAPLAPAFHDWLFRRCHEARVVVNIGGIANITVLHSDDRPPVGFDTGPGNTLLDVWVRQHTKQTIDSRADVGMDILKRPDFSVRITHSSIIKTKDRKPSGCKGSRHQHELPVTTYPVLWSADNDNDRYLWFRLTLVQNSDKPGVATIEYKRSFCAHYLMTATK